MTKDVIVSITGLQFMDDPSGEKIEIITPGSYYKKQHHHYVIYDEVVEGSDEITKNMLKFDDASLSLSKKGFTNVDMVFEENKRNMTNYVTPYGSLLVGIDARNVDVDMMEDKININIDYALDINYTHLANCQIKMSIMSKSEEAVSIIE